MILNKKKKILYDHSDFMSIVNINNDSIIIDEKRYKDGTWSMENVNISRYSK